MANTDPIILSFQTEGLEKSNAELKATATNISAIGTATNDVTADIVNMTNAVKLSKEQLAQLKPNTKEFKDLSNEIKAAEVSINGLINTQESLRAEFANVKKDIGQVNAIMKEMEKQGLTNTNTYKGLVSQMDVLKKKGGELKDSIGDMNQEFKTLGSDTRGIDTVLEGVQGITAGFQIAQGASALFGGENKKLEETLVKLNATMSIAQGLQQVQQLLQKETAIGTGIMATAQTAWNFVIAESTIALSAMRAALLATGIVAAIALVYGLYEAFKDLVGGTEDANEALKRQKEEEEAYKKSIDDTNEALKQRQEINDYVLKRDITLAKAKGQSLEELRKIEDEYWSEKRFQAQERYEIARNAVSSLLQAGYKKESEVMKAALKEQTDAEKNYYKTNQEFQLLKAERVLEDKKLADEEVKIQKEKNAKLAAERQKEKDDAEKTYDAITKKQSDVARNVREEKEKERKQREKDDEKELERLARIAREEEEIEDKKEDKKTEKQIQREKNIQEAKRVGLNALQETTNAIFEQNAEARQTELNQDLENLNTRREAELNQENLTKKEIAQINKKYEAEERATKTRAWKAEKEAKLTQSIINGALAITNILATAPFPTWIVAIPAAIAATALQVATIAATKPPKFAEGGSVAKRLGYIDGKPHSAGGELIEVEGNEYVMKGKAVNKYGVDFLDSINNLQMETMPKSSSDKRPIIDYNKLGNVIGQKLNENPRISVNVDKRGVNVSKGGNEIMNNYVSL